MSGALYSRRTAVLSTRYNISARQYAGAQCFDLPYCW